MSDSSRVGKLTNVARLADQPLIATNLDVHSLDVCKYKTFVQPSVISSSFAHLYVARYWIVRVPFLSI